METKFLITLCLALSFCVEVNAEGEQEVKRGLYPFMAFLYYPDETVIDGSGARFLRAAVLIQPDWLITSAVGPSILNNNPGGFPRKTLLARAGAITIDTNFTLNEDEDEQEREIVQIVRPYNHSATQWWHTDISLMRTLQPFNMTSAVSVTMLVNKMEYVEKTCTVLVYAKKDGNWTEDRNLMQLTVELLPPSVANCGHHFLEKTMTCAADSDENKNIAYDSNYCLGNRGGPLICEGDVIGIQTYVENDCKAPHLYQMLSAWDNFIACGTEDKCHEEQCSKICDVVNKDPYDLNVDTTPRKDVETIKPPTVNEVVSDISFAPSTESQATSMTPEADLTSIDQTTVYQSSTERSTQEPSTSEQPEEQSVKETQRSIIDEEKTTKSWPREKYTNDRKAMDQDIDVSMRQPPKVEAQQQNIVIKKHSSGETNVLNHSIIFGYFILARLI